MSDLEIPWIVGFVDGEGCFFIGINARKQSKFGFTVLPEFVVVQHERDIQILYALKAYWGFGTVCRNHGDRFCYKVRGLEPLLYTIVPFFEKHPLKTKKNVDFLKFRDGLLLIEKTEHLTIDGLLKLDKIRLEMNRGLSIPRQQLFLVDGELVMKKI